MFMYVGNDYVIESKEIIAIFDIELVHSSVRLNQIVHQCSIDSKLYGSKEDAKSVLFTDGEIYYSPLSTLTLKNRDELYQTMS